MDDFGNILLGNYVNLNVDTNVAGSIIRMNTDADVYSIYGGFTTIRAGSTIMLTGLVDATRGGYQIEDDIECFVVLNNNNHSFTGDRITYTKSQANKVIKQALTDDYYIMKNLLILSACWDKLNTKERDIVHYLYRRLSARQFYYQKDTTCLTNKEAVNIPTSNALSRLNTILNNYTPNDTTPVGIVMTTVAINVTAIVIAALVAAAFITTAVLVYKWWGKESSEDRALSDKTVKLLKDKGLTDSEIEQIVRETNGAVTKAEIKAKLSTGFGIAKIALIGVGAFFTYKAVKSLLINKKKSKEIKKENSKPKKLK